MITSAQRKALETENYSVEDMGAEWGDRFQGQYRWMNDSHDGDGFGAIQYSAADAWTDALQFDTKLKAENAL